MINMLDAERVSNDFEVVKPSEIQALKGRIEELENAELDHMTYILKLSFQLENAEAELLKVKRAAADGAWCRRNHTSDGY